MSQRQCLTHKVSISLIRSSSDEKLLRVVPFVVDDDVLAAELLLGGSIDHLEKRIEVLSHDGIVPTHLLDNVFVHKRGVGGHSRSLQALRLKLKVELLQVGSERILFLGHFTVSRVVIVNAQVNKLLLHLINDLPACGIELLLEILVVSGSLGFLASGETIVEVTVLSSYRVQKFGLVVICTIIHCALLTLSRTPMLNRCSEAASRLLDNGLTIHVGNQVFEGGLRLFVLRLALKVDGHQWACLD